MRVEWTRPWVQFTALMMMMRLVVVVVVIALNRSIKELIVLLLNECLRKLLRGRKGIMFVGAAKLLC